MVGRRRKSEGEDEDEYFVAPDYPLELLVRDPLSGKTINLGVTVTMRDLEVLGSAGGHYADEYRNADRPAHQVEARRERARRVGDALWEAAVERCGIEEP